MMNYTFHNIQRILWNIGSELITDPPQSTSNRYRIFSVYVSRRRKGRGERNKPKPRPLLYTSRGDSGVIACRKQKERKLERRINAGSPNRRNPRDSFQSA